MTDTTTDAAEARARYRAFRECASKARLYANKTDRQGRPSRSADVIEAVREVAHIIDVEAGQMSLTLATAEAASGAGEREAHALREALYRAAVDLLHTPRHNREGAADQHIRESRERIRQSLYPSLPPATDPAMGQRYQHVKRGTVYEVVGEAKVQDAGDQGIVEGDVVVVYRGDDGQLWAREYSEFHDGRFATLAAAPTIPATGEADRKGMTPEWCLNMARLEEGQEIGAGIPDHPLRVKCELPPAGWLCTREPGHDGPCATIPATGHAATEGEGA